MKKLLIASSGALIIQPVLFLFYLGLQAFPSFTVNPWKGIGYDWLAPLFVAIPHLIIIGIPVFLLLNRYSKLSYFNVSIAGLTAGTAPLLALNIFDIVASGCDNSFILGTSEFFSDKVVCDNDFITFYGLLYVLMRSWIMGLHGIVGAVVFYILWSNPSLTTKSKRTGAMRQPLI
jgi:chromate transport protein ChrA